MLVQNCHPICFFFLQRLTLIGNLIQGKGPYFFTLLHPVGKAAGYGQTMVIYRLHRAIYIHIGHALHIQAQNLFQLFPAHFTAKAFQIIGHNHILQHTLGIIRVHNGAGETISSSNDYITAINAAQSISHIRIYGIASFLIAVESIILVKGMQIIWLLGLRLLQIFVHNFIGLLRRSLALHHLGHRQLGGGKKVRGSQAHIKHVCIY